MEIDRYRVHPLNFNIFSMTKALKSKTFYMLRDMKEGIYRGHELPLILSLRTTHKVPVTVQEDVEDTTI